MRGSLPQVAPSNGVVTRWQVKGVGLAQVFVGDVDVAGNLIRRQSSAFIALGAGISSGNARLPIKAGQTVGLFLPTGSGIAFTPLAPGASSAAWTYFPAPADGAGAPPNDDDAVPATPPKPSLALVAYSADIEPDADGDGFGDETQDKCKGEATPKVPGGKCVPPAFTKKPKVKTVRHGKASKVAFTISEAATLKATIALKSTGRKVGKTCKKTTRGNAKRKHCTRYVNVKSLKLKAKLGKNNLSLGKRKAGGYRLTLVATDANGAKAKPVTASFKVR